MSNEKPIRDPVTTSTPATASRSTAAGQEAGSGPKPGARRLIVSMLAWAGLISAALLVAVTYVLITDERYPGTDLDQPDLDSLLVARFFSIVAAVVAAGAGGLALLATGRQRSVLLVSTAAVIALAVLRLVLTL